jgi:putative ABC transport system substrate-binding protein
VLAAAPDVVVAISHPAIGAARAASASVPIVMAFLGTDPVASGFAASLARPGGNVTGVAMLAVELDGKRASLLREALPGAKRIGVLAGQPPRDDLAVAEIRRVAEAAGVAVQTAHVADPAAYAPAMAELRKAGAEGLVVISAPEFFRDAALIAKLAAEAGLPTACEWASMARDGCLIGYGPNFVTLMQRPATHIAAILSGASPATLPIEQPAVFEFAVNLKTAKALGLTLPQLLLARADEVIE